MVKYYFKRIMKSLIRITLTLHRINISQLKKKYINILIYAGSILSLPRLHSFVFFLKINYITSYIPTIYNCFCIYEHPRVCVCALARVYVCVHAHENSNVLKYRFYERSCVCVFICVCTKYT